MGKGSASVLQVRREWDVMASIAGPNGVTRRSFMKYAALGGVAAFGVASGLVYPRGWQSWLTYGRKPWELAPGVVDYEDKVLRHGWGPSELGFDNDIRNSPLSQRALNIAQWYDYWPGKIIRNFTNYMEETWNLPGVSIRWTSNIYTSNEELFTWVSQTGRKFDLMFPTNYTVETMEKAGLIVNLKKEWIPNFVNIFGKTPTTWPDRYDPDRPDLRAQPTYPTYPNGYNNEAGVDFRDPALNGYLYRMNTGTYPTPRGAEYFTWNEDNSLISVPYQWGTTGIGYRSDIFRQEDIEEMGWDVFQLNAYRNPTTGQTTDLVKRKMMLDDMREVFTAALKAVGWQEQLDADPPLVDPFTGDPTAVPMNPAAPWNGRYQWSNNEVVGDRLQGALDWLLGFKGTTWGFNTPQQGPWLVSGTMYVDQAWSGDIMYAVRPNSSLHLPVAYFVPRQGGARWIDNSVIHRECEKLWLAHEFINYIHDPQIQAEISSWNLYATPNAWTFELLHNDNAFSFFGQYPDGRPYEWNPAEEPRIYSDIAIGYTGEPILSRCEYQKDVGVRETLNYFRYWRQAKF